MLKNILGLEVDKTYDAVGCPECSHGYKGRIAIQEVLLITEEIKDAISSGFRKDQLRELVYTKDVITMLQDGLFKVIAGFTNFSEIFKLVELDDETSVEEQQKIPQPQIQNQQTQPIQPIPTQVNQPINNQYMQQ